MTGTDEDFAVLTRRLNKMEKEARFVRYLGALLAASMVVIVAGRLLAGAGEQVKATSGVIEPCAVPPDGRFESVTTRSLQVTDDKDRVRASISAGGSEDHSDRRPVTLRLYGEETGSSIVLTAGGTGGPEVTVFHDSVGRATLGMNGSDPMLQLIDAKGKSSAVLWYMKGTPHLVLTDERGRTRAVFGYESAWSEGPGRPTKPVPTVMALYDDRGQVMWSATGETKAATPVAGEVSDAPHQDHSPHHD